LYLEKNEFKGSISFLVCNLANLGVLREIWTDCKAPPDPPRVSCSCCTRCYSYEEELYDRIVPLLSPISNKTHFDQGDSSQSQALSWLINDDPSKLYSTSPNKLLQRYILTLFGFTLFPVIPPVEESKWFTGLHECEWNGVTCDENSQVTAINIGE